jgi:hypothetical protein
MKKLFLTFILLTLSSSVTFAYFPRDTITTIIDNPANNTVILATSTRTLLYAKIDCETNIGIVRLNTGATGYLIRKNGAGNDKGADNDQETQAQLVTANSVIYTESTGRDCNITVSYVNRDRTITPDPIEQFTNTVTVGNFPTGFNVNNFPALASVNVNNFPTLQDIHCVSGCTGTSTLIFSSSTIEILTTTAPTFQEWMLVVGVFLAINSIHMWNFLFRRPKTIIRANKIR